MEVTQQNASTHFGLGKMRLDAKPAFLVRARSFFDHCKQRTDNSFGLRMMPLKYLAFKFLLATVFETLIRLFVGNNSVKQFESSNSQVFHVMRLLR